MRREKAVDGHVSERAEGRDECILTSSLSVNSGRERRVGVVKQRCTGANAKGPSGPIYPRPVHQLFRHVLRRTPPRYPHRIAVRARRRKRARAAKRGLRVGAPALESRPNRFSSRLRDLSAGDAGAG